MPVGGKGPREISPTPSPLTTMMRFRPASSNCIGRSRSFCSKTPPKVLDILSPYFWKTGLCGDSVAMNAFRIIFLGAELSRPEGFEIHSPQVACEQLRLQKKAALGVGQSEPYLPDAPMDLVPLAMDQRTCGQSRAPEKSRARSSQHPRLKRMAMFRPPAYDEGTPLFYLGAQCLRSVLGPRSHRGLPFKRFGVCSPAR